tara:strand:- start:741 stop:1235 length:495 start_codon:yes stop_codon:yes gene_type:complete
MSKFKKLYRDFFSLKEQAVKFTADDAENAEKVASAVSDMADDLGTLNANNDPLLDEAQLVNNLTDYNGHVIYQLRDPQESNAVAKDIQRWTTKKGFTIIAHKKSKTGRTGYFYFRIGEDPGSESQKIQGYFAQLPELTKFAFKKPGASAPAPQMAPRRKQFRKI